IVDGDGAIGQAGGDAIADLLDQARRDDDVSAVVLRVNSPGGSVWASEQIRRAVDQLKADGKPVVASMRSEEHTSELQSLMRISYAVFCLKKKNDKIHDT